MICVFIPVDECFTALFACSFGSTGGSLAKQLEPWHWLFKGWTVLSTGQTADGRRQTADCRLQTADRRPQISDCKLKDTKNLPNKGDTIKNITSCESEKVAWEQG